MGGVLAIGRALLSIPRAFWQLLQLLWRLLEHLLRRTPKRPGRLDKAAKTRCVPIDDPAMRTPDPLVYSQYDLMARGLPVTWDNPDFGIFLSGVKVDSHDLIKDTEYAVVVRVWNASLDCPVAMMPVHLSYLDFGIGTVSVPVATRHVDVGVVGAADNPTYVTFAWRTPNVDGHYCLQALLEPASDVNWGNNLGQHNTDVVESHSPGVFTFTLRNDTTREHPYGFGVDAYVLMPPRCEDGKDVFVGEDHPEVPLPPGWTVALDPAAPTLAPAAVVIVKATVTPPATFSGSQVVNIHAFYPENHSRRLAGGVTVTVHKA